MHIRKAKNQIKNAVIAYNTKDSRGKPVIPVEKQRPIFLIGAPGIGKTAIVEQIAKELGIGFVSYAMTHHTRQSALGLPFIEKKKYGGTEYNVSEYTMSEIIASVYEEMEKTGKKSGILFLDEINCVSETLAPSMLQFLQYKTFGRHSVPEGWIVVTAGNPPEYNDAVRDFDIAMLDRLKKITVEPDYRVWKEFATETGVHPSVLSYLAIKPQYFYRVTTTIDSRSFVTARGWDDLSTMIMLYDKNNIDVDYDLVIQYVQDEEIAKDFANYYDLYRKYSSDYKVHSILEGNASREICERASKAGFDERLSLISLIITSLDDRITDTVIDDDALRNAVRDAKSIRADFANRLRQRTFVYWKKEQETDTREAVETSTRTKMILESLSETAKKEGDTYDVVRKDLAARIMRHQESIKKDLAALDNVFTFFEDCFGNGQEMLILVSELTIRKYISRFIYSNGCDKYYKYNRQLLFRDRENDISDRIDALNLLSLEEER